MYKTTIDCSGDTKAAAACANRLFRDNGVAVRRANVIPEPGKLCVQSLERPLRAWLARRVRVFAKGFSAGFTAGQVVPTDAWVCDRYAEIVREWRRNSEAYIAEHGCKRDGTIAGKDPVDPDNAIY